MFGLAVYNLEDDYIILTPNVGNPLPSDSASYPRLMESSAIPLREPQNLLLK
jgi:hypothetical protein